MADLPLDETRCRGIATQIALSTLLGAGDRKVVDRILTITNGEFDCPALNEFLSHSEGREESNRSDVMKPKALVEIYVHTHFFEATAVVTLAELKAKHFGTGIEIIAPQEPPCITCNGGKHQYRWSEIINLPKLPRHWRCRCLYASWTNDIRDIFS